tara:strand:+ start:158 stop:472 length:315 start_codon:yes stop_codon:yes gene_type:complete
MYYSDVLKVEKTDIEHGIPSNPCECAIAKAVRRQILPKLNDNYILEPFVEPDGTICIREEGKTYDLYELKMNEKTYLKIRDFINDFDDGEKVTPFQFDFSLKEY